MSKQYQVIEKDGQKYLEWSHSEIIATPVFWDGNYAGTNGASIVQHHGIWPYLGTKPIGATLREDQVRETWQYFDKYERRDWVEGQDPDLQMSFSIDGYPTRVAFTDAEPALEEEEEEAPGMLGLVDAVMRYRQNHPEVEKPDTQQALNDLHDHLSNEHGLILLQSELQEIVRLAKVVWESEGYSF